MESTLQIILSVLAVLLIGSILLQAKGTGLGAGFGGDGNVYRTKRGIEKKLHTISVALSILFIGTALANILF